MTTININPHKNIAYSFFTLTIIALLLTIFGLVQGLYQAKIIISAKRHTIETTFNATFGAKILQENLEAEETFIPKTVVSMEDFATGEVTIINNSAQNQALVANTRLLSPDKLLFRLTTKINVPSYQKIRANVRADKPGQEYEISPTKFTIPGLSPILQTKIYAESKEPMAGGFKKRASSLKKI